jgi:putative addiction module component (TIGR02574 family)
MRRNLEDIAVEALELGVESRAALAKRLLDSLDDLAPEEYERMWVEEAARRYEQLKDGTASSLPSDEVFARLEARSRG